MTDVAVLKEGLYRIEPAGVVFIGGACTSCGFISFPIVDVCLQCGCTDIKPVDLGGEGTLFCETTVHMRTDKFAAGYCVGYVVMPGGIRIFGQIDKPANTELKAGTPMRVGVGPLWKEAETEVISYRFVPMLSPNGEQE